jgi:D-glycero-D-manno-heptose 1,7-bisphosphate phosphatase
MIDLILLDRDGVINKDRSDYVKSKEEFELLPRVIDAIKLLNKAQIPIAVVTNQGCVGKGIITLEQLHEIHDHLQILLESEGAFIQKIIYCTDTQIEPNFRRKPAPGMLKEAISHFKARSEYVPIIGDSLRDLEAGAHLGCPRFLVRTGHGQKVEEKGIPAPLQPVTVVNDLYEAVCCLIK